MMTTFNDCRFNQLNNRMMIVCVLIHSSTPLPRPLLGSPAVPRRLTPDQLPLGVPPPATRQAALHLCMRSFRLARERYEKGEQDLPDAHDTGLIVLAAATVQSPRLVSQFRQSFCHRVPLSPDERALGRGSSEGAFAAVAEVERSTICTGLSACIGADGAGDACEISERGA